MATKCVIVVVDDDSSADEILDTLEFEYRNRGCVSIKRGDDELAHLYVTNLCEDMSGVKVIRIGDFNDEEE